MGSQGSSWSRRSLLGAAILAGAAFAACAAAIAESGSALAASPRILALFSEENIPPEDMTPTPGAAAPGSTPDATQYNGPAAPLGGETPAPQAANTPGSSVPAAAAQAASAPLPAQDETTLAAPAEPNAPLELGAIAPKAQISDHPLQPVILHAASPALAASLRVTDAARKQLLDNQPDTALQTLGRAISIDPDNPYAYFYVGRGWLAKNNYDQALTFLKRAEIGFGSNPDWLGETLTFEGTAYEESGKSGPAFEAYQRALRAEPGNLAARVGSTRLAPPAPTAVEATVPEAGGAGVDSQVPPAPAQAPPPPPPVSAPPPTD